MFDGESIKNHDMPFLDDPSVPLGPSRAIDNYYFAVGWISHPQDRYTYDMGGVFYLDRPGIALIVDYDWGGGVYNHPGGGASPAGWNVYRATGNVEWLPWRDRYPEWLRSLEDSATIGGPDYELGMNQVANGLEPTGFP